MLYTVLIDLDPEGPADPEPAHDPVGPRAGAALCPQQGRHWSASGPRRFPGWRGCAGDAMESVHRV